MHMENKNPLSLLNVDNIILIYSAGKMSLTSEMTPLLLPGSITPEKKVIYVVYKADSHTA